MCRLFRIFLRIYQKSDHGIEMRPLYEKNGENAEFFCREVESNRKQITKKLFNDKLVRADTIQMINEKNITATQPTPSSLAKKRHTAITNNMQLG